MPVLKGNQSRIVHFPQIRQISLHEVIRVPKRLATRLMVSKKKIHRLQPRQAAALLQWDSSQLSLMYHECDGANGVKALGADVVEERQALEGHSGQKFRWLLW